VTKKKLHSRAKKREASKKRGTYHRAGKTRVLGFEKDTEEEKKKKKRRRRKKSLRSESQREEVEKRTHCIETRQGTKHKGFRTARVFVVSNRPTTLWGGGRSVSHG